jgi:hypothetical protein
MIEKLIDGRVSAGGATASQETEDRGTQTKVTLARENT